MTTEVKHPKWNAAVSPNEIIIGKFTYLPGQAAKITALIGFAGNMSNLKALPPQIEDTPFVIEFTEDGSLKLHSGNKDFCVPFKFEDTDDLIVLINNMVQVSIDSHTLRPHARGINRVMSLPGNEPL